MPFDALSQLEGQGLVVFTPGPALGEVRHDRLDAVLRDALIVDNEVVVDRHEGDVDRIGRALVDRGAARTVPMINAQDAALFRLGRERHIRGRQQTQTGRKRTHAPHVSLPRKFGLIGPIDAEVTHDGACTQPARPGAALALRTIAKRCVPSGGCRCGRYARASPAGEGVTSLHTSSPRTSLCEKSNALRMRRIVFSIALSPDRLRVQLSFTSTKSRQNF